MKVHAASVAYAVLRVRHPVVRCLQQASPVRHPTAEQLQAHSPVSALAPARGQLVGGHQLSAPGLAARSGYGGPVPFMQVNVNLIQSPYPPRPVALHPPPSFNWAAGPAHCAAAPDGSQQLNFAAQQQDAAAALAAWAAPDVAPHVVRESATKLGSRPGQELTSPHPASSGWPTAEPVVGSREGPPRLAPDARATQSGGPYAAAVDAPAPSPQAPHSAREQPPEGDAPSSQPAAAGGHGQYDYDTWSAQFPIAAAFTQLLSPAAVAAAHAMGHIYPQVRHCPRPYVLSPHAAQYNYDLRL